MTRFQRATQVARWAMTEFKIPQDLRLELKLRIFYQNEECWGLTYPVNGRMTIFLSDKMNPRTCDMVETVIHELTHAELYDQGLGIQHGPKFWKHYGRQRDAFDHHGKLDSLAFPKR